MAGRDAGSKQAGAAAGGKICIGAGACWRRSSIPGEWIEGCMCADRPKSCLSISATATASGPRVVIGGGLSSTSNNTEGESTGAAAGGGGGIRLVKERWFHACEGVPAAV